MRPRWSSSPPETMSKPQPRCASSFKIDRLPLALTAKHRRVRTDAEAAVQFVKGVHDGAAAVHVGGRAETIRRSPASAKTSQKTSAAAREFFQREMRREPWPDPRSSGSARALLRDAHFTFSDDQCAIVGKRRALREPSRLPEDLVGDICRGEFVMLLDEALRMRVVPKNWPSLFAVSAMPSEWNTRMSPTSSVTPHSSY